MRIDFVEITNFRKLRSTRVGFARDKTVFVGANNSGKTSAMVALRWFLVDNERSSFTLNDFTISHWPTIIAMGAAWEKAIADGEPLPEPDWQSVLPALDVWLHVESNEVHYVQKILPTLDWEGGQLGVRLRFEPKDPAELQKEYLTAREETKKAKEGGPAADGQRADAEINVSLWPNDLADFLRRRLGLFVVKSYTVASVIVPRPDRFYLPSLLQLAFIQENPSVKVFRQAIAIDERRRMFRLQPWVQPQTFMRNRFSKTNNEEPQDILQVWFAGVHADIGGGYPEKQSGLSKYPLLWMVEEAVKCGLKVDRQTVNQLGWGRQRKNSPFSYVAPDFMADPHDSMSAAWRTIEYIPKADKYKEWPKRESVLGHYIPDAEPRPIPDGAFIHGSVVEKRTKDSKYRPVNMPAQYQTIPILTAPVEPAHDAEDPAEA
jgi:hypothetical protein